VLGERSDQIVVLSRTHAHRFDPTSWHPLQSGTHLLLHEHEALGQPGVAIGIGIVHARQSMTRGYAQMRIRQAGRPGKDSFKTRFGV
jgi:hypothetical protein